MRTSLFFTMLSSEVAAVEYSSFKVSGDINVLSETSATSELSSDIPLAAASDFASKNYHAESE